MSEDDRRADVDAATDLEKLRRLAVEVLDEHAVTWRSWKEERRRAAEAEAERDRLRAKLHKLMARDVDVVDMMNVEYGCPDCGVHHACGEIVAERDRLRAVVEAARMVLAVIDSTHIGQLIDGIEGHDEITLLRQRLGALDHG